MILTFGAALAKRDGGPRQASLRITRRRVGFGRAHEGGPSMADTERCPNCGSERPGRASQGLCPRCLLQQALDGDSLGLSHNGGPTANLERPPKAGGASNPAPIAAAGPVPRVLLRDTDTGAEPPVVRVGADTTHRLPDSSGRL